MSVVQFDRAIEFAAMEVVLVSPVVPHAIPTTALSIEQESARNKAPVVHCSAVPCALPESS